MDENDLKLFEQFNEPIPDDPLCTCNMRWVETSDGWTVCSGCGIISNFNNVFSNSDVFNSSSRSKHIYNEFKNFKKNISKIFCKEIIHIPRKLIYLTKDCNTKEEIMTILKKQKWNHFYIYINYISHVLLKTPLPCVSGYLFCELIDKYSNFRKKFNNQKSSTSRKNQLKTVYLIERFLTELNRDDLIPYLPNRVTYKPKLKILDKLYNDAIAYV